MKSNKLTATTIENQFSAVKVKSEFSASPENAVFLVSFIFGVSESAKMLDQHEHVRLNIARLKIY
jgi:hypothetical protein